MTPFLGVRNSLIAFMFWIIRIIKIPTIAVAEPSIKLEIRIMAVIYQPYFLLCIISEYIQAITTAGKYQLIAELPTPKSHSTVLTL